ncbi:MAG: putative nicotinate-nucleotide adenylyltransferase [candidate division WS2 bacterium]|uniref:Probable nicotinate-nucleotide adenylyltransferase n=1 Tax=Psychracetigena formicireducens TaxID=2986056 RepID=A0A9E2BL79_PSYF1|nr:putative nicotinate-nucleotide adenylyltransferase [Candidatus Psychracetigena formicireducens]MBT9145089.1 putative nicotinate-nucleotide adenylyltransferase [Candidatus Psychracetigena formicireducens]MBT9150040.1 putative nicotinate-nucleotide adenylyltransferase [Candidatus Psychracetigena formicireducens]
MSNKKYGLIGGTFDPVHIGHLLNAQYVIEFLDLRRFYYVPAFIPPHKQNIFITPYHHRLKMLELACMNNEKFAILNLEMERGMVSYTVETLKELRKLWGEKVEIFYLLGIDSFLELPTWKNPREISSLARLVVLRRNQKQYSLEEFKKVSDLLVPSSVMEIPSRVIDVTASEIRKRVKDGLSIKYMVTKEVEDYIYTNKLYI